MKTEEEIARESIDAGDPWAVTLAKKALVPVSVLTLPETVARMQELPVTTDVEETFAAQLLREVKDHWVDIEKQRKAITGPLNVALKATNSTFRPHLDALEEEERILKNKLAERHAAKHAANTVALQQAAVATTPQLAQQAMAVVAPVIAPQGVSVRYVWKFEVTNPELVPHELCSPDPAKIAAAAAMTQNIPGVRFFQEPVVTSRSR